MPSHLIDVRTAAEFSTGHLPNAVNIEYQDIASLSQRRDVDKNNDDVTLYCRSGRRSAIALQTLRELGFEKVRDIGGLEEAEEVLRREVEVEEVGRETGKGREGREARERGFGKLVDGLRGLEDG